MSVSHHVSDWRQRLGPGIPRLVVAQMFDQGEARNAVASSRYESDSGLLAAGRV